MFLRVPDVAGVVIETVGRVCCGSVCSGDGTGTVSACRGRRGRRAGEDTGERALRRSPRLLPRLILCLVTERKRSVI